MYVEIIYAYIKSRKPIFSYEKIHQHPSYSWQRTHLPWLASLGHFSKDGMGLDQCPDIDLFID